MGTVIIPPDQKEVIKILTTPAVYGMIDRPEVITLAELDSFAAPCGVIVFLVSGDEGAPAAHLEYLYIDPDYRGQGIATDLLRSTEDILFMSDVKKLSVTLCGDDSDIGTFLEDYGFSFTCNENEVYISLSADIPEDKGRYGAHIKKVRQLSDMTAREIEAFISDKNELRGGQARELIYGCNRELSLVFSGGNDGWGILLTGDGSLRPEVTMFYAAGSYSKQIKEILAVSFADIFNKTDEEYIKLDAGDHLRLIRGSFFKYYKEADVFNGEIEVEAADNQE